MSQKLTRKGALNLTAALDRIASTIQSNPGLLGLDPTVALDFAKRADQISDAIELTATTNFPKEAGFDAGSIGEEVGGPLEQIQKDEPYMSGAFTQTELGELTEKQESGSLPKVDKLAHARIARIERILIKLAAEEEEETEEEKPEGKTAASWDKALDDMLKKMDLSPEDKMDFLKGLEKKVTTELKNSKKASAGDAGFNLFE